MQDLENMFHYSQANHFFVDVCKKLWRAEARKVSATRAAGRAKVPLKLAEKDVSMKKSTLPKFKIAPEHRPPQ